MRKAANRRGSLWRILVRRPANFNASRIHREGERIDCVPTHRELKEAAASLRRIMELTAELNQDSQADAAFRERLELAAEVLEVAATRH
jgi:hypothetical protein